MNAFTPPRSAAPSALLSGSVADLPITDVLRLLGARAHTGVLLVNPRQPLWLVLAHGEVVFGGSTSPLAVGRQLLASGDVDAETLGNLFGLNEGRRVERAPNEIDEADVIEALARSVDHPTLADAVAAQAVAMVFEMMLLADAEMTFTEGLPHRLAAMFMFPIADIVAAATLRVDQWPALAKRIGGDAGYFRRVRRIARDVAPVVLGAEEWAALCEIDERATVGQIAHRLGRGRADTYALLAGLCDRGVIEPAG